MAIHSNERLPVQQEQVLRTVKMRNEKSKEVRGTRSSEEGQKNSVKRNGKSFPSRSTSRFRLWDSSDTADARGLVLLMARP